METIIRKELYKMANNLKESLLLDEQIILDIYDDSKDSLLRQSINIEKELRLINSDIESLFKISLVSPKDQMKEFIDRYNDSIKKVERWDYIKNKIKEQYQKDKMAYYDSISKIILSLKKMLKDIDKLLIDPNFILAKKQLVQLKNKLQECVGNLAKDLSWIKK